MSKIKVSLIEDTSASDAEENHEPDETASFKLPELCDEPPIQPREKPKRIRKKPEPPPPPLEMSPPPPEKQPEKQQAKGKIVNCIHCGKVLLEKTFKYYHQLKCKPKEESEPVKKMEVTPETLTVDFGFRRKSQNQGRCTTVFAKAFF